MAGGYGLTGPTSILNNIAANLVPVQHLITGAAYLIGVAFAFKAIYSLKAYGEARTMMSSGNANLKEPLAFLFVAGIFIYLPTGVAIILNSTFGSSSILQYAPVTRGDQAITSIFGTSSTIGRPLALIIQTIGIVAFIRGWVMLARSASQGQPPGGTGKGLMHIFGGILAMNIVATIEIINNTLYG